MNNFEDNNSPEYIGEEYRNQVISELPLHKQLALRGYLKTADSLSREQAIEMLKESLVLIARKDQAILQIMKGEL